LRSDVVVVVDVSDSEEEEEEGSPCSFSSWFVASG
jgi:hypothetical protein